MATESSEELIAVHVCKAYGTAVNPDNTITGLPRCPHCGHKGDLNIEIRAKTSKRPPGKATQAD